MASYSNDFIKKTQPNFLSFIDKLQELSREYGVVVYGHFDITDEPKEFENVVYDRDISSSDIRATGYWGE
ncbi:MAG: hypothetical protein ACO323_08775 [Candidatus Kapaibacteriota bacterium]